MAHDVFISYSAHDKIVADATCAALEAQRIRCWIAPRDVLAGTEYGEAILNAIENCRAMVLVFSAHANESPHIRREVERAVSKGKFIVPFRIENVLPSGAMEYCLGNTHWLDALTPPLEMRIEELVASTSRLLKRPDGADPTTPTAHMLSQTETQSQRFSRLFAERPDVIQEVEGEASQVGEATLSEFETLLVRLEVNACEPRFPGTSDADEQQHRERLLGLIELHEGSTDEARAFVSTSREQGISYEQWNERLTRYQRATGGTNRVRGAMVARGGSYFPLVCLAFRRYSSSNAFNCACDGYNYTWRIELELAKVMSQIRDFRALPFFAEAILRNQDSMNGHHDWGLGIARAVRAFGVGTATVDSCFERLAGVSSSDILREKRDRER